MSIVSTLSAISETDAELGITQQLEAVLSYGAEWCVGHRYAGIKGVRAQTVFGDVDLLLGIVVRFRVHIPIGRRGVEIAGVVHIMVVVLKVNQS